MARLKGTKGKDKLIGTSAADLLEGLAGNDTLVGKSGNDRLFGDAGNDILKGGAGNDQLFGGGGRDKLVGGAGNDTLVAGPGADVISGGGDTGSLFDPRLGVIGGDILFYADATEGVEADLDAPGAGLGGAAGDTWSGVENLAGSPYDDVLDARAEGGRIWGAGGNDHLYADAGIDEMYGGEGEDWLHGHAGSIDYFKIEYDLGFDHFVDLVRGEDKIVVSAAAFGLASAPGGVIAASELQIGTSPLATSADVRLVFDTTTRTLWADKDGTGSTFQPIEIAVLDGLATLSTDDLWVVV